MLDRYLMRQTLSAFQRLGGLEYENNLPRNVFGKVKGGNSARESIIVALFCAEIFLEGTEPRLVGLDVLMIVAS